MPQFSDTAGRSWQVALDFVASRRVKAATHVDLSDLKHFPKTWAELLDDANLAISLVWALVKPQADALSVSEDDWLGAMNGDTLDEATAALGQAVVNHVTPAKRAMIADAIVEVARGYAKAVEDAQAAISKAVNDFPAQ